MSTPFSRHFPNNYRKGTIIRNITLVILALPLMFFFGRNLLAKTTKTPGSKAVHHLEPKLWTLKNKLYQAHRLARYTSERNAIRQALFTLHSLMTASPKIKPTNSHQNIGKRQTTGTGDLGPDTSVVRRVTVLLHANNCERADRLVKTIRSMYQSIQIQVAVATTSMSRTQRFCKEATRTEWLYNVSSTSSTWATLASRAKTELVFVARNLIDFSSKSDLNKLLWVFDQIQVDVVGGAVRLEPESKWYAACYKTSLRNFTLRFHPGHDLSEPPCVYCDYVASPFIIRRDLFQNVVSRTSESDVLALVDVFLQLTHGQFLVDRMPKILSCMDVMFHVTAPSAAAGVHDITQTSKSDWLRLARSWSLNRIVFPGPVEYSWNCQQIGLICSKFEQSEPSMFLPPCCLEERARCLQSFLRLTQSLDISTGVFELDTVRTVLQQRGTSLPWTSPYAIGWDASKATLLFQHLNPLTNGYQCHMEPISADKLDGDQCKRGSKATCLYHWLRSSSWRTKLIGYLNYSSPLTLQMRNPTRVNVYGFWLETYTNPGLVVQKKFTKTDLLTFDEWKYSCPNNVIEHACLTKNVLPQGNIQFDAIFI